MILTNLTNKNLIEATERIETNGAWGVGTALTSVTQVGVINGRQFWQIVPSAANNAKNVTSLVTIPQTQSTSFTVSGRVAQAATGGIERSAGVGVVGVSGGFATQAAIIAVDTSDGSPVLIESGDAFTVESSSVTVESSSVYLVSITMTWVPPTGAWFVAPSVSICSVNASNTISFAGDASTPYGRATAIQAEEGALSTYNRRGI